MHAILMCAGLACGQAGGSDPGGRAAAAAPIDGAWSVVSMARGGDPAGGAPATATIRDGVLTFGGAGGADQLPPMRVRFGPMGTVTMGEAGAATGGVRSGVYVMTDDHLALSVFDTPSGAGAGTSGSGRGSPTRDTSGTGAGVLRPEGGAPAAGAALARPVMSVVLRRTAGTRPVVPGPDR